MVKIIQEKIELNPPKINVHVKVESMGLDMMVVSIEHLVDILKHQHETLKSNVSGSILINKNDNTGIET